MHASLRALRPWRNVKRHTAHGPVAWAVRLHLTDGRLICATVLGPTDYVGALDLTLARVLSTGPCTRTLAVLAHEACRVDAKVTCLTVQVGRLAWSWRDPDRPITVLHGPRERKVRDHRAFRGEWTKGK